MNPLLALALAGVISYAGRRLSWLTGSGALAASLLGGAVLWGGGLRAGAPLALFFVSGSILARRDNTAGFTGRNYRQILANGGWPIVGVAAIAANYPVVGWSVLAASLAAAQGDTWSTEIGVRSGDVPRWAVGGEPVAVGTSGGVTPGGTAGGIAGVAAMILVVWLAGLPQPALLAAATGGLTGMVADSLLGATVQVRYRCAGCGSVTETTKHLCGGGGSGGGGGGGGGGTLQRISGVRWIDNDMVNLLATGSAAVVGLAIAGAG